MRGKGFSCRQRVSWVGITPAYAGKSFLLDSAPVTVQDHPRLCGEKLALIMLPLIVMGSPPPMRGKAQVPPVRQRRAGITPAYAGKSRRKGICRRKAWDHPRLCGEKITMFLFSKNALGSPPPMRGKEDE